MHAVAIGVQVEDGWEEGQMGRHRGCAGPFAETGSNLDRCLGEGKPSAPVVAHIRGGRLELDPAWLPAVGRADMAWGRDRARAFLGGGRLYGLWRLGADASGARAMELRIVRIRRGYGTYRLTRDASAVWEWDRDR